MITDMIALPEFEKSLLGKKSKFWFLRLFEKTATLFEWKNLPDTVNRDYLETALLTQGSVIWIKDKENKLRALMGAHYGFDPYNFPTTAEVANPVLGNLRGTFGVNAVWMRNNVYALPVYDLIREYAVNIAQLDVDLKVNLDNLKLARVFNVNGDAEAKQVRELYKKIVMGEPAVILNGQDWMNSDKMQVFSNDIAYLGTSFLTDRRTQINDFLTQFGIDNIATEKKERLIVGEVEVNNQELEINKNFWLKTRQEAAAEVNKMFGTNISVDIVGSMTEDEMKEKDDEMEDDENV